MPPDCHPKFRFVLSSSTWHHPFENADQSESRWTQLAGTIRIFPCSARHVGQHPERRECMECGVNNLNVRFSIVLSSLSDWTNTDLLMSVSTKDVFTFVICGTSASSAHLRSQRQDNLRWWLPRLAKDDSRRIGYVNQRC